MAIAFLVAGALFMQSIDATMIVAAMPAMGRSFQVDAMDIGLGVSAYLIALAVLVPVSGLIADRFGARKVFVSAIGVFTAASILCGVSLGLKSFVAARILQGAGGALMVPVGRLVVLNNTPKHKLISAIAALTWPALVAPVLGPPLGGLITVHIGWRWIFWVNLPIGAIAAAAALALIPGDLVRERKPFDWPGFALTGLGLVALMFGAELVSLKVVDWERVTALLAMGAVLLAVAIRYLLRAKNPMVPLKPLEVKTFAVTIYGGSLFRMSVSAVPFLLPLMFQIGFGFNPVYAGFLVMAVFAGNVAMKPATTPIMRRFGFKPVLLGAGLLNTLLILACAFFTPTTPEAVVLVVLFAGGLVRSMQFTALNTLAFADIPKPQMSGANTLFSTAFQIAWGLGVVLASLCLRFSTVLVKLAWPAALVSVPGVGFRLAFVLVAAVSLLAIGDSLTLAPDAGEAVSRA